MQQLRRGGWVIQLHADGVVADPTHYRSPRMRSYDRFCLTSLSLGDQPVDVARCDGGGSEDVREQTWGVAVRLPS